MAVHLSAEQRLIVAGIRAAFGRTGAWRPEGPIDWDRASELAIRHGLGPLVQAGLAALDLTVPGRVRTKLRATDLSASSRVEQQLGPLLRQVLGALAARGLDPIVLKGAALAYLAYPSPALRSMSDVDLLLRGDQVEQADAVLRALGFQVDDTEPAFDAHLWPHVSPDGLGSVELHHRLLHGVHRYVIDLDDLWARSRVRQLAGVEARVLAPTDFLLHVCLHQGYGHRYRGFPLRNLVDILAMATAWAGELDWQEFLERVRRSRTAGPVYWPLWLARRWLGAPIPDLVLARLAPPAIGRALMATVVAPRYLLDSQPPPAGSARLYNLLLDVSFHGGTTARDQLRFLVGSLFPPPDAVGHLPSGVTGSRLRYAAHLANPARGVRGLTLMSRWLLRQVRP